MLIILYFFLFIFGVCIGSFLNAWLWRLHRDESMFGRRSYCPKCSKQLKNFDLVPLLSFLFLGGKCRFCKVKISWQYPLVEFVTGVLFLFAFINVANGLGADLISQMTLLLYWYFIAIMIVIFVYDLKYYLILDRVSLPAMVIILLINLLLGASLVNLLIGAVIGAGFFAVQFYLSGLVIHSPKLIKIEKKSFGKWVGGGDIRLGALIGFMLGWQGVLITLFIAYVSGSVIGLALIFTKKKKMKSQVPFGPFLSAAAIITLLWGNQLLAWYQGMMGII